jgi:hypothetical protein
MKTKNENKPFYFRKFPEDLKTFLKEESVKNDRNLTNQILHILKTYQNERTKTD